MSNLTDDSISLELLPTYSFITPSIDTHAPTAIGVYYCGALDAMGRFQPYYIGRAIGESTSSRSRLLDHLREEEWQDVTHFCFQICSTPIGATYLEEAEIKRFNPKYKKNLKLVGHKLADALMGR
jgi:hypothetical protein